AAPVALAQSTPYSFDNFDTSNGVKIYTEPSQVPAKRLAKNRKVSATSTPASTPTVGISTVRMTSMTLDSGLNVSGVGSSLRGFTTGNAQIDNYVSESATRNGLDPLLIYSIMHQESSFKLGAISPKGARGLMQLMPGTAARYGVSNIFDPKQNIEGGARYMKFLLDHFDGDLSLALAGYNAGEGAVEKYGFRIPPYAETQEYVRRISRRYNLLRDPNAALYAPSLSRSQLARLNAKPSVPLTIYERSILTVRLPDGRLQLMTQ
ncbi:MAG TPA: lytic transglycosylase domain-containing protein, partial [Pyrinomonadaceae bacterium]